MVRSIVRRYAGRGESHEDLEQAGMLGLTKAMERFDFDAGHRFISSAVPNITGEIRRYFRDCTWAVHVPRSVQELDARIEAFKKETVGAGGREPTEAELASALGVPVEDVREAIAAGESYRAVSYDAPLGEGRERLDVLGADEPGYRESEDRVVLRDALMVLDDRCRRVVELRYRDGLLQREIAAEIGVSQMQVSRLLSQSIDRMAETVTDDAPAAA